MSYCINPDCTNPENSKDQLFCHVCNSELLREGQYRVLHKLGGGGFCYTYEVEGQDVLKVLKVLHLNDPIALRLFKQEPLVLRKLNYPGIPRVEQNSFFTIKVAEKEDPLYCFVMEKIEGRDLGYWLEQRQKSIDQNLALKWLRQIVNILQEVHSKSFFHRDIKPTNIMLRPNGQLTLIDFGTAKEINATLIVNNNETPSGTRIDSPGYSPAEQKNGHITSKSDFFALGRTFVHLLTGQHPLDFYDYNSGELSWHIDNQQASDFVSNSRLLWGADVDWNTAMTYDAAQALIEALKRSNTRTGIQEALSSPDFSADGVSERIKFFGSGDRNGSIQLVKVKKIEPSRSGTGYDFVPES